MKKIILLLLVLLLLVEVILHIAMSFGVDII